MSNDDEISELSDKEFQEYFFFQYEWKCDKCNFDPEKIELCEIHAKRYDWSIYDSWLDEYLFPYLPLQEKKNLNINITKMWIPKKRHTRIWVTISNIDIGFLTYDTISEYDLQPKQMTFFEI